MKQLAIIGAGVAGLAAAQSLKRRGVDVVLYEKSRGVGGRAATRRVHGCIIDHGAQVVQAPTPRTLQLVLASGDDSSQAAYDIGAPIWVFDADGVLREGDPLANANPRWCWPNGMTTLSQSMAGDLDIRLEVAVHHVAATGAGYTLYDAQNEPSGQADAVLFTPPGPQTAEIIAHSDLPSSDKALLLDELARSTYRRSLSVALAYPFRPAVPWYAILNLDRQHAISWLACEHAKPGHAPDRVGVMLAQMSDEFSRTHWDQAAKGTFGAQGAPLPEYIEQTHQYIQTLLHMTLPRPLWADVQRWRYALPETEADFELLNATESRLYFAGDYVNNRGRVYQAMERGWQVAEMIAYDLAD